MRLVDLAMVGSVANEHAFHTRAVYAGGTEFEDFEMILLLSYLSPLSPRL